MINWREFKGFWADEDQVEYDRLIKTIPDGSIMVEIGSFRGKSLCSVAQTIKDKNLKVFSVDIFDKVIDPQYDEPGVQSSLSGMLYDCMSNLEKFGLMKNVNIFVGTGMDFCTDMIKNGNIPNLVFIDANHDYEPVKRDIEAWLPIVAEGGILCGHDFGLGWPGVYKAVTEKFGTHVAFKGCIWRHQK